MTSIYFVCQSYSRLLFYRDHFATISSIAIHQYEYTTNVPTLLNLLLSDVSESPADHFTSYRIFVVLCITCDDHNCYFKQWVNSYTECDFKIHHDKNCIYSEVTTVPSQKFSAIFDYSQNHFVCKFN